MRLFILTLLSVFSFFSTAQTLTFGVVPQQPAQKLASLWYPVLDYLSQESGITLQFKTAKNIPEFEHRLANSEYDIAYMNPYHYTVFHQSSGYEAIAKRKNSRIRGIIVVRKDNPIKKLRTLNGEKLAFPSPAAFAASILTKAELTKMHISFFPVYVTSHDSVYLSIANGFFVAGGGVLRTYKNADPSIRKQLRIFWETPSYTPHAIAVLPKIHHTTRTKIINAMINMSNTPAGLRLLKRLNFTGIEKAKDSDWNDVRSLDIKQLDSLIK